LKSIVDKLDLKGFLSDYISWSTTLTDACTEFLLATALTCLSSCIGSKVVYWSYGTQRRWPNLYTLLLGPPGLSRKTESLTMGRSLVSAVDPLLIADGVQTREKFILYLAAQPTVMWPIPEFSAVLGAWNRSYADGYKEFITDWFDCLDVRHNRIVGNKKEEKESTITIKKAAINILAGSTIEWLRDKLTEGDLRGGLMGRFLIFPHTKLNKDPGININPFQNTKEQLLVNYLKAIYTMPPSWVETRGVADEFNTWQKKAQRKLELNYNPDTVGFQARAVTHILKLAVLICVSESPEPLPKYVLTGEQLEKAILLGNWLINEMMDLAETGFSKSKTENYIQKLLEMTANEPVRRSDALRSLHCTAREFDAIKFTAIQRRELRILEHESITKPGEWYQSTPKVEPEL